METDNTNALYEGHPYTNEGNSTTARHLVFADTLSSATPANGQKCVVVVVVVTSFSVPAHTYIEVHFHVAIMFGEMTGSDAVVCLDRHLPSQRLPRPRDGGVAEDGVPLPGAVRPPD